MILTKLINIVLHKFYFHLNTIIRALIFSTWWTWYWKLRSVSVGPWPVGSFELGQMFPDLEERKGSLRSKWDEDLREISRSKSLDYYIYQVGQYWVTRGNPYLTWQRTRDRWRPRRFIKQVIPVGGRKPGFWILTGTPVMWKSKVGAGIVHRSRLLWCKESNVMLLDFIEVYT